MSARWVFVLAGAALVGTGCLGPTPEEGTPAAARPAFATDIPASITTPNELETSIGTLRFSDGFPDEETARKVYDNLDLQRGTQAFLTGLPYASMYAMGAAIREFGPANETVLLFETLMDSRTLFLTPNTDSVYMMMWLDLSEGPMVLETPPNVLGIIDDAWFRYVADFGNAGPDLGKGGRFLILPPGYDGDVPDGYHTYQSGAHGHWVIWRGFKEDGDPGPAVAATRKQFRTYRLGEKPADRPTMNFVNVSGREFNTIHAMDFSFFEELDHVVQSEPAVGVEPEILGLFASIGIRRGSAFEPDARMRQILTEAAQIGSATARALAYRSRNPETFFYEDSAWGTPFVGGSYEFLNDGVRLLDARSYFFFYATGITPAMSMKKVGVGSQYALAFVDSKGRPLDGGKDYRLRLPAGIPARDFWSIVLYDNQTRSMLQTDQEFPSVGSQKPDLVANADGSVDLYFGPEAPSGKEGNWVQTIPGKGFNVILRLYGPLESWFDKTWKPGEFKVID